VGRDGVGLGAGMMSELPLPLPPDIVGRFSGSALQPLLERAGPMTWSGAMAQRRRTPRAAPRLVDREGGWNLTPWGRMRAGHKALSD